MTFAGVLPALRDGKKVTRRVWDSSHIWWPRTEPLNQSTVLTRADLLASDWELVEEPEPHDWKKCKADYLAAIASCNATIARLERELAEAREMAKKNGEGWQKEAMRWSGIGGERMAIQRRLHQFIEDIEDGKIK